MCGTCGCGQPDGPVIMKPGEEDHLHGHQHTHHHDHSEHHHDHPHSHGHSHEHDHEHMHSHGHLHEHEHYHETDKHVHEKEIMLERDILHENSLLAERNRGYFEAKGIYALNLVSSPGSGKTTLLEKTIRAVGNEKPVFIIEGDQQTMNDANRIKEAGAPVIQINTGSGCHLDANMINQAVRKLEPSEKSLLFIENVGNLVCPSMFDLGESKRILILSVTEGDDKPSKYPNMFETSDLCIINKTDLLPYVDFSIEKFKDYALKVNHHIEFIELSARTGEGMEKWLAWLEK